MDCSRKLHDDWFDYASDRRERLIEQTPEPFTRRNIYCGNRMFDNKYKFVERYRRLVVKQQSGVEAV